MIRPLISVLSAARPAMTWCALVTTAVAGQEPTPACQAQGSREWLASRASPLDSATLTVGPAIAKICYSRPSARGRSVDSLVPLRIAWRTGANEPTTITLTRALNVGGAVLVPGRYVILTVPNADRWSVVFHTTPDTEPAKMFRSMVQVAVGGGRVERADPPIERFTIHATANTDSAAFVLEWGTRRVYLPVRSVPSSSSRSACPVDEKSCVSQWYDERRYRR